MDDCKTLITRYGNGKIRSRVCYRNKKLNGICEQWYENGNLYQRRFFQNGNCEGESKIWYDNGYLMLLEFY